MLNACLNAVKHPQGKASAGFERSKGYEKERTCHWQWYQFLFVEIHNDEKPSHFSQKTEEVGPDLVVLSSSSNRPR